MDAIRKLLIQENPKDETRNKFALVPRPDCADYELRVGTLRAFYSVMEEAGAIKVVVALIGRRDRSKLIVEVEAFELCPDRVAKLFPESVPNLIAASLARRAVDLSSRPTG